LPSRVFFFFLKKWYCLQVEIVSDEETITDWSIFKEIDIEQVNVPELDFQSNFSLTVTSPTPTTLRAFITYFDCMFDDFSNTPQTQTVTLSTSPATTPTHWQQTVSAIRNKTTTSQLVT
jgi:protein arginine N-methyltransferase 3